MIRKKYSAGAVKFSFWFMEFRREVTLLSEGRSFQEIKELSQKENLFGAPTPARAAQICSTVTARIRSLDESFYPVFLSGDLATQKLFALVAAMADDTLFFDFVYGVIRDKLLIGSNEFTETDVKAFFRDAQLQDEKAARWTDETVTRLARTYKTMLYEAGVIDPPAQGKEVRRIYRPILEREMEDWLLAHDMECMIQALTGGK